MIINTMPQILTALLLIAPTGVFIATALSAPVSANMYDRLGADDSIKPAPGNRLGGARRQFKPISGQGDESIRPFSSQGQDDESIRPVNESIRPVVPQVERRVGGTDDDSL